LNKIRIGTSLKAVALLLCLRFEHNGIFKSTTGSCKFVLQFGLEFDLGMARVSAIYGDASLYAFTLVFIQAWQGR
jgi:hypothetical protein